MSKVKAINKMTALLLVVVLAFAMATTAFAAAEPWPSRMATWPQQSAVGYQGGYTQFIQRHMLCYGGTPGSYISAAGGVDGSFGNGTLNAVKEYQKIKIGAAAADGIVGANTWRTMGNGLSLSTNGGIYYFRLNSSSAMLIIPNGSLYNHHTYNTYGTQFSSYFRQCTY